MSLEVAATSLCQHVILNIKMTMLEIQTCAVWRFRPLSGHWEALVQSRGIHLASEGYYQACLPE